MSYRSLFNKLFIPLVLTLVALMLFAITLLINTNQEKADALSATDFNAGRIVDDAVFYNKDSMSAANIQSFLDRLIPNCDVWGTGNSEYGGGTRAQYAASRGWPGPPYTCLNKYYENTTNGETSYEKGGGAFSGGTSAAQIIYNAAQEYGINPQVLLVLLKKESAGPLTSDSWPLKSQYKYAMGYACPDSGPGNSANCDSSKAGFYKQVNLAAWQLKYYKEHPNDYRYKIGWNDIQYSPTLSCGTKRVYIENIATLSLYIYTPYTPNDAALRNYPGEASCGAYGNRNFFMYFSEWFGSPSNPPATKCNSKLQDIACVWSVRKDDGSQFLTSSESELANTMSSYGWVNEGIVFYASGKAKANTVPVYRLRNDNQHYYTADLQQYAELKNTAGWSDEGIRFYALPSGQSANVSHKIYRLRSTINGHQYWVSDGDQKEYLLKSGYTLDATPFNSFSSVIPYTATTAGRDNIYALKGGDMRFYSTNLKESDSAIKSYGYQYDSILTTANTSASGTAVYRLNRGVDHFYTTDPAERDMAVSKYGMTNEGVRFYIDAQSAPIYRLSNTTNGYYLFTSDLSRVMALSNKGWKYEKVLSGKVDDSVPVLRFFGAGQHFYTANIAEAAAVSNNGYAYEKIAFTALSRPTSSTTPVYRLYGAGEHFYTMDANEKDNAVTKYGYKDEGIRFYMSQGVTSSPIYRLYGAGEHFYTMDANEKDNAVTKYGYKDEGIRFYAPAQ